MIAQKELVYILQFMEAMESIIPDGEDDIISIYCLTREMAEKAGYHREKYHLKNGKERERTAYTAKFDDVLTAKWFIFFRPFFIFLLKPQMRLREWSDQIALDTFLSTMRHINFDKITDDAQLNNYVKKVLRSKIIDYLAKAGTLQDGKKHWRVAQKRAVNNGVLPLEILNMEIQTESITTITPDIVLDLKIKLRGKKYGNILLESMINSCGKLDLMNIDKSLQLCPDECTGRTLTEIKESYKVIRDTVMSYTGLANHPYCEWKEQPVISFSKEKECI